MEPPADGKRGTEGPRGDQTLSGVSPWDILAGLGDSLAVLDPPYRIVWAREPLLSRGQSNHRAAMLRGFCYQVFAGRSEVCESAALVYPGAAALSFRPRLWRGRNFIARRPR